MASQGVLRHLTRNFPRRRDEVVEGGSMYWVIAGSLCVRQPIEDIVEATYDDGSRCAAIVLVPGLVALQPRRTKPFQGWRYLAPTDAPPDLAGAQAAEGQDALPPAMREELRRLGLL